MVRATERHNRRRHREGQTQPWTIKHGSRISGKPRGCGYKLVGIMGSGVDIVVLCIDISVLVLNAVGLCVDISVLVSNAPVLNVDIRI